ncbi:MAG: hypothetical protein IJP66_05880, partial [Kiritimatiellae bacterium]|nr:hypothetical protein [Kiritimatiellia bacterium]
MHRQLAEPWEVRSEGVALTREAARHCITVLRLQVGDELELFDGAGASATFRLCADGADGAEAGGGGMPDARRLLREG